MATLLFNSNFISVILPSEPGATARLEVGSTFALRCIYACWTVADLSHEWGVDDFPGKSANWVASFLASPQSNEPAQIVDLDISRRTSNGEFYWTALYPTKQPIVEIPILCISDADRFFFGVATNDEESASMFRNLKSYDAEAWLTVMIEEPDLLGFGGVLEKYRFANLVIHGEAIHNWTKAIVNPVPL
jgi:hypothetical protein